MTSFRFGLITLTLTATLAATACSSGDEAASSATSSAASGGASAGEVGGSGDNGGAGGTSQGGGTSSPLAERLVGAWKPTFFVDSGMPEEAVPEGSPFYVFSEDQKIALGCGSSPFGDWTVTEGNVPGGLGTITVTFGGSQVKWYVLELDASRFVFAEGGDEFIFARATCP